MEIETDSLLDLLRRDLEIRRRQRPHLSLRYYSQQVGVDQSLLTKLLNGKRKPSNDVRAKVIHFLGLTGERQYEPVANDVFALLSDWLTFALVEHFKSDPKFPGKTALARKLGVDVEHVAQAMRLLTDFEFISINKGYVQILRPDNSWFNPTISSSARKLYQKSILALSQEAIDEVPFEQRDHSSLTVALDPELLPELKEVIRRFRREMDALVTKPSKNTKKVYQLQIGLFPTFRREA